MMQDATCGAGSSDSLVTVLVGRQNVLESIKRRSQVLYRPLSKPARANEPLPYLYVVGDDYFAHVKRAIGVANEANAEG